MKQWEGTLRFLREHGPLTANEAADLLNVGTGAMYARLNKLAARGLATKSSETQNHTTRTRFHATAAPPPKFPTPKDYQPPNAEPYGGIPSGRTRLPKVTPHELPPGVTLYEAVTGFVRRRKGYTFTIASLARDFQTSTSLMRVVLARGVREHRIRTKRNPRGGHYYISGSG